MSGQLTNRCLLVKKCGKPINKHLIELFFEKWLPDDVDLTLEHSCDDEEKAIFSLSRYLTCEELSSLQKCVAENQFKDVYMSVERAPIVIQLKNISNEVTSEAIKKYFESDTFSQAEVDDVQMYSDNYEPLDSNDDSGQGESSDHTQYAVVTFKHMEVISDALLDTDHTISGIRTQLVPCHALWKPTIPRAPDETELDTQKSDAELVLSSTAATTSSFEESVYPVLAPEVLMSEPCFREIHSVDQPKDDTNTTKEIFPIPIIYYRLLKESLRNIAQECRVKLKEMSCSLSEDMQIKLKGPTDRVEQAKIRFMEEINGLEKCPLSLSKMYTEILRGDHGMKAAEERVENYRVKICEIDKQFVVIGNLDDAPTAAAIIDKMFAQETIPISKHHKRFVEQESAEVLKKLKDESHNCIEAFIQDDVIEICGIDKCVADSKATLLNLLSNKTWKEEKVALGNKGIWDFVQRPCFQLSAMARSANIETKPVEDQGQYYIECQGGASDLERFSKELNNSVASIVHDKQICDKRALVAHFLDEKSIGHIMIKSLENSKSCFIEVTAAYKSTTSIPVVRPEAQAADRTEDKSEAAAAEATAEKKREISESAATADRKKEKSDAPESLVDRKEEECTAEKSASETPAKELNLKLENQDITKVKADVIVNSISTASKHLTKCGAISKAMLQAGGEDFGNAYKELGGLSCGDVKSTPSSGSLACKEVYHASIRKWDGHRTQKLMYRVVNKCISDAKNSGHKSIAFPTFGCGKFAYPVTELAKCFKDVAEKTDGIEIILLAQSKRIYDELASELPGGSTKDNTRKLWTERKSSASSSPARTVKPKVKPKPPPRQSKPSMRGVIFNIYARTQDEVDQVKQAITNIIQERYSEETVPAECLEYIPDKDMVKIEKLTSELVIVVVDSNNCLIEVCGERDEVKETKRKVERILAQTTDPVYMKKYGNKKGYLWSRLKDQNILPKYWTKYKDVTKNSVKAAGYAFGADVSMADFLVDVNAETRQAVEQLVLKTWEAENVGIGSDAKHLTHKGVKVKKVQRIENPKLYEQYHTAMCDALGQGLNADFPTITSKNSNIKEVETASLKLAALDNIREQEVNEYFLFHGTKADIVKNIVLQGMDSRLGSRGLFGEGIYFAEKSTKADQYADPKTGRREDGDFYMIIARVLLGWIYHSKKSFKDKRPPCTDDKCEGVRCAHTHRHDSILGTTKDNGVKLLFREFVVYDNRKAYPEFLVTYNRLQDA